MDKEVAMWLGGFLLGVIGVLIMMKVSDMEREMREAKAAADKALEDALTAVRVQEDKNQAAVALLWERHDADVKELETLKLTVAGEHYKRFELDSKFDKLETTFRDELHTLGEKFDKLGATILSHVVKGDRS